MDPSPTTNQGRTGYKIMTDNTTTPSPLSKAQAELVVRDRAATYVEEHGADHTLDGFPFWVERLSSDVEAPLNSLWLADVLLYMEATQRAEEGTHPGIVRNGSGTIDNSESVLDYEEDLLSKTIDKLLIEAGFAASPIAGKAA